MCRKSLIDACQSSSTSSFIKIDSIKTCIKKTDIRIRETIKELEGEINRHAFLRP